MNTAEVIERLELEGVSLTLTPSGGLDVFGDKEALGRVLPFLRNHKAEIVDLLTRMKPAQVQAIPTSQKQARVSPLDLLAFCEGYTWLRPLLSELTQAGWSRPELFRRNRARRGIAWLPLWADKDVTANLTAEGFIRFTIARGDRTCMQTSRPMVRHRA